MSMAEHKKLAKGTSVLPGRWSLPLLVKFFLISPVSFFLLAAMDVIQQFIAMASFLIPIKLLFLASRGAGEIPIPHTDFALPTGQLEVTLMILPLGMLPLINSRIKKYGLRKREELADKVGELELGKKFDAKQLKTFKTLVNSYSRSFSSFCLASSCLLVMLAILPKVALILASCVLLATLIARYRIASHHLQQRNGVEASLNIENPISVARRINDTTHASSYIVLMPLFVYLMAGSLLNDELDPIFALAFLLLFRLFVSNSELCSAMAAQFLHGLIKQRGLLRQLDLGVIRL